MTGGARGLRHAEEAPHARFSSARGSTGRVRSPVSEVSGMMLRLARIAVCGVVAFAQQPTFKSATALVEVDAVVFDRNGNFVPGLKAENITLLENGKPQKIQQFFMV